MQKFYTVFVIFDFRPQYFYLFVNFLDLVFNNFGLSATMMEDADENLVALEYLLIDLANNMNLILLGVGCMSFLIFLYTQKIRTPVHKFYVVIRFIIIFTRLLIYIFMDIFYIKLYIEEEIVDLDIKLNFLGSLILTWLEVNDVIFCFYLKDIVFFDPSKDFDDYLNEESQKDKKLPSVTDKGTDLYEITDEEVNNQFKLQMFSIYSSIKNSVFGKAEIKILFLGNQNSGKTVIQKDINKFYVTQLRIIIYTVQQNITNQRFYKRNIKNKQYRFCFMGFKWRS